MTEVARPDLPTGTEELPLPSGRITRGVVRLADTVRRPAKPSSSFVAELLAFLAARDCTWAPRYLGRDSEGRDVLSYVVGSVPAKWQTFTDEQVRAAASLLRALHDATAGSTLAPTGVVCHHDPGPNNFVFREELPIALIDFDTAAAGSRLEDLGHMAWAWCLSSNPARGTIVEQTRQVRTLANAYGLCAADRSQLPRAIVERVRQNVRFWSSHSERPGSIVTAPEKVTELVAWSRREQQYVEQHSTALQAALR